MNSKYTPQEKQEIVDSFKVWNYRFDLGDGIITEPSRKDHQVWQDIRRDLFMGAVRKMFKGSLKGKRFLDIGCNAGFWTHEFLKIGASSALAVDKRAEKIRQAQFVWDCLHPAEEDTPVEFKNIDIFDLPEPERPFDFILALGVLYHFTDPIGFLKKMHRIVRDFIFIDTAVSSIRVEEPILEMADGDKYVCCGKNENAFIPNEAALVKMLRQTGFSNVLKIYPHKTHDPIDGFSQGIRVAVIAFKD